MDNSEEFRCISLFSGYAGLELGLKRAAPALRTVCYVEREAFACANLVAKIEKGELDAAPVWTDIKTFPAKFFLGRIHLITRGYPCQPFSVAGKRRGTDDPRHLWPHIERIVEAVRPLWCFFENVSGHLGIGFPAVYRSLHNLGYKVEAGLFTAEELGAPHKRERLFILAYSGRAASGNQNGQAGGRARQEDVPQGNGQAGSVRPGTASELGDTKRTGQQSSIYGQGQEQFGRTGTKWPSRPGQSQYEWEEPRVVVNTTNTGLENTKPRRQGKNLTETCYTSKRRSRRNKQAQSRLGRAANGTKSRVDRLRLLGNGVVPQQAELAFRELMKLF